MTGVVPVVVTPDPVAAGAIEPATWEERASLPAAVGGRAFFASAMNSDTGEIVIMGGEDGNGNVLGDTRICKLVSVEADLVDTSQWSCRSVSPGPTARRYATLAYDPILSQFVLFGGANASWTRLSDTWVLTAEGIWQQRMVPGPSPRDSAAAIYDPAEGGIVLFGGHEGNGVNSGETWVWDGLGWSLRASSGPSGRHLSGFAHDPLNHQSILFGGEGALGARLADTWVWDASNAAWDEVTPTGTNPLGRRYPTLTFDAAQRKLVLFGGLSGSNVALDDTWFWNGRGWAQVEASASPPARHGAALYFDPSLARSVLIGGTTNDGIGTGTVGALSDAWTLGPSLGSQLPSPPYPSNDASCSAASNVVRGFVGNTFLQVRTGPEASGGTAVCVAADDGVRHLGGKLVVNGAPGLPLQTDAQAGACDLDANNQRIQSGMLLGQPYHLDVAPAPDNDADLAWVCVQAMGTGVRMIVTTSGAGTGTRFEPDVVAAVPGGYAEEAWPVTGQPSETCKAAAGGKTRLLNLRVGASDRVALYAWQESTTKAHACFRGQSGTGFAGGKLTVDGAGVPAVTTHSDLGPCTFAVFTTNEFPQVGVYTSDPDDPVPPASACVQAPDTIARVTVSSTGSPPATFEQDTG